MKKLIALAVSAALAASATSALADSLADTIMAKPSSEATAGIHLSLGGKAHQQARPVYGASIGFRTGGQTVSQSLNAPVAKVAEFNLAGGKVQEARVGTLDFARSETNAASGEHLNLGSSAATVLWIALAIGAIYFLIDTSGNGDGGGY